MRGQINNLKLPSTIGILYLSFGMRCIEQITFGKYEPLANDSGPLLVIC